MIQDPLLPGPATNSIEERNLIGAIVDDLLARSAREEYCTWLEDHRDPRLSAAQLLAKLARSCKTEAKKRPWRSSNLTGFNRAWCDMLGFTPLQAIAEDESCWNSRALILKYLKPCIGIVPTMESHSEMSATKSRFGGLPALPPNQNWPECEEGPLQFIAQVSLDDIQFFQASRCLPQSGLLSFFALNGNVGGCMHRLDGQAFFYDKLQELQLRQCPSGCEFPQSAACKLNFIEAWDLPDSRDLLVKQTDRDKLGRCDDLFAELRYGWQPFRSHFLGYVRHSRSDDPSPNANYANLFRAGSYVSTGWSWADDENLSYYLPSEDFGNCNLEKVRANAS